MEIAGTNIGTSTVTKTFVHTDAIPKWPTSLDAQFAEIRKLLPTTGPDAPTIAAFFGKKTKARINQIEDILKTLRPLGKLE